MTWQPEIEELKRRQAMAEAMGGPDKVKRQHDGGRLTVRERVLKLVDKDSFNEVGAIAGRGEYDAKGDLETLTPSNCVMGRAEIDGRPVVVLGDDFTVRGGSADATIREKPIMAERMANELRLPIIRMIEGSGGGGSVKTIETTGRANLPGGVGGTQLYHLTAQNLGLVPVVALGLGSVAGLARLDGLPVAVMASDPVFSGGSWTADACAKIIRFVDMAETFHLPVVYLMDCPGFAVGLEAEKTATIRWGVRAMAAVNQCRAPWCTVILRNAFGVAGVVHQPAGRYSIRYAWPSGRWGSLPLEGGIEAAYAAEVNAATDPVAKIAEIDERLQKLRSPFRTAEAFWVEEIIDPRETRPLLCDFARLAEPLRGSGMAALTMRP